MNATEQVLFFVVAAIITVASLVLLVRPHWIIRAQAKFYGKAYKNVRKMDDKKINKVWQTPWDRSLMGSHAEFIQRGAEQPETYRGLASVYRALGCAMLGMILAMFVLALLATVMDAAP